MTEYKIEHPEKYWNRVHVTGLDEVRAKRLLWNMRDYHEEVLRVSTELNKNVVVVESLDSRDIQHDEEFLRTFESFVSQAYLGHDPAPKYVEEEELQA